MDEKMEEKMDENKMMINRLDEILMRVSLLDQGLSDRYEELYLDYKILLDEILELSRLGELSLSCKNKLSKKVIEINNNLVDYKPKKTLFNKIWDQGKNLILGFTHALSKLKYKNGFALLFTLGLLAFVLCWKRYPFLLINDFDYNQYKIISSVYFAIVSFILFYHIGGEYMKDKTRNENYFIDQKSEFVTKQLLLVSNHSKEDLIEQYKICIELEKHYERVMWDIGKVLLTGSAAALPYTLYILNGDEKNYSIAIVALLLSIVLYNVFLFLSKRYRGSIRKFRNSAELIEKELKWLPYNYAYTLEEKSFGNPIKVWTIFVGLYGIILSGATFIFLEYILKFLLLNY
ncbi:hypothetical protein CI105_05295 [Candidatus Izimaplasma bacterium ZiA1]|uniref:hypothetical protein n=1 Tax=Candidatus Izimoplasma sp. ZiA1 TaxID=2024899 RepID=UPI000BAA7D63|nr:hypothetical protein CI105_05295 [Candidatus Izimaplasma bacterium ZiA1]